MRVQWGVLGACGLHYMSYKIKHEALIWKAKRKTKKTPQLQGDGATLAPPSQQQAQTSWTAFVLWLLFLWPKFPSFLQVTSLSGSDTKIRGHCHDMVLPACPTTSPSAQTKKEWPFPQKVRTDHKNLMLLVFTGAGTCLGISKKYFDNSIFNSDIDLQSNQSQLRFLYGNKKDTDTRNPVLRSVS